MLTKAHIKNFKSLRDVTLTFGRNNVLVGPNMSGKSNVIDFFRFVRDMLVTSQGSLRGIPNAVNPRIGFLSLSGAGRLDLTWKGAEDPLISFELEGKLHLKSGDSGWRYAVSILGSFEWGSVSIHEESLTLTTEAGTAVLIETNGQKRNVYSRTGKDLGAIGDTVRLALEYEFPDWQEGKQLRESISNWRFYNLIPVLMRKPNAAAAPDALTPSGDNLSAWLMLFQTRFSESFDRIRSAAQDILPDMVGLFTTPTPQASVYIASNEKSLQKPITVAEMSDGELAFIALLSLLYAPPELKADICFIEEPENHLHPRMLAMLMDLLRQVQLKYSSSEGQLFLTTHSPYLLDNFSIEELLLLSKKDGATCVTRPGDKAELKNLISDEEIGLGDLFYTGALSDA